MASTGRVCLITGAGGTIASETALQLAGRGVRLVLADLSEKNLLRAANAITSANCPEPILVTTNLTNREGAEAAVAAVIETFGRLDWLVNAVGGVRGSIREVLDKPLVDLDEEEWQFTLALNLTSTYMVTRQAVPYLIKDGGAIVNFASMAYLGKVPRMGNAAYDAAKAGVVAFTRTMARQLGPRRVRVNCVAPGLTLTPRVQRMVDTDFVKVHLAMSPLGQIGEPGDVAAAVVYLLSDEARHVTGEVIHISGGI